MICKIIFCKHKLVTWLKKKELKIASFGKLILKVKNKIKSTNNLWQSLERASKLMISTTMKVGIARTLYSVRRIANIFWKCKMETKNLTQDLALKVRQELITAKCMKNHFSFAHLNLPALFKAINTPLGKVSVWWVLKLLW